MRTVIKFTVAILVAIAIVAVPIACRNNDESETPAGPGRGRRPAQSVFSVRTEEAQVRTLQAYIEVNADIVSEQQVVVMPEANGRLVSMRPRLGSFVQRGTLIAEVDPSRPGTTFSLSPVHAPVSGTVITTPASVGSTVTTSTSLMTIAVNRSVEIKANIPEREVAQLRNGLAAEVMLEAFPGEIFPAAITIVSPVINPISRAKEVTLRFNRPDNRIVPGMFAKVKLMTRAYENVVSIPSESIIDYRGSRVVFVLNSEGEKQTVSMREVESGVSVDGETEIRSGVSAGEIVVTQGQRFLTDGAEVRVIGGAQ